MKPVSPVIGNIEGVKIAENQPEYNTLPAIITSNGEVISRWKLTLRERLIVLFKGNIFLCVSTFGGPVQPVDLQVTEPILASIDIEEVAA